MNYVGVNCPICDNAFEKDDDIVVCPSCGAPYHRECYKAEGHCIFKDEHETKSFTWNNPQTNKDEKKKKKEKDEQLVVCPRCFHRNSPGDLFCKNCGRPIENDKCKTKQNVPPEYMSSEAIRVLFDPMGGVDPKEDFDDVLAEDLCGFVGVNTQYYMRNFKLIKDNGKGKFNIAAFFSPGVWMLYRKQYKLGLIALVLYSAMALVSGFISEFLYASLLNELLVSSGIQNKAFLTISDHLTMLSTLSSMPIKQQLIYWTPKILNTIIFVFSLVVGAKANKMYMNFCISNVKKIKNKNLAQISYKRNLNEIGGTNPRIFWYILLCAMAISFIVAFMS